MIGPSRSGAVLHHRGQLRADFYSGWRTAIALLRFVDCVGAARPLLTAGQRGAGRQPLATIPSGLPGLARRRKVSALGSRRNNEISAGFSWGAP